MALSRQVAVKKAAVKRAKMRQRRSPTTWFERVMAAIALIKPPKLIIITSGVESAFNKMLYIGYR